MRIYLLWIPEKAGTGIVPNCKKVVETRVLLEGYCQTEVHGILAKRHQVVCGTDAEGSNGCGKKWFTLEIPEDKVWEQEGREGNGPTIGSVIDPEQSLELIRETADFVEEFKIGRWNHDPTSDKINRVRGIKRGLTVYFLPQRAF